jgi:hypothetical protein
MATEYERFLEDINSSGFGNKNVQDTGDGARAQRAYIAFKLFQIEEHLGRAGESAGTGARKG